MLNSTKSGVPEKDKNVVADTAEVHMRKAFDTLSQVTTTPDTVKTQFDRVRDQEHGIACIARSRYRLAACDLMR
jgi:hypothetical protein